MKLEVLDTVEPREWDATAERLGGVIGHSSVYAQYLLAAAPNATARYFRWVTDSGEIMGLAIGFVQSSTHAVLAPWTKRLAFPTTPIGSCVIEWRGWS